ncbi:MAG TPA: amidase [Dehalococcoidia bacterium]|nr:amidase [Dehalococcoidia bacterium]
MPAELTAAAIVEACRSGTSAVKVLDRFRARVEEREPEVRAWETLDLEGAYRQAEALDRQAAAGRLRGLLHGVPIAMKDVYHVAGLPCRAGSPVYHDFVPQSDAPVVRRLREQGAVILGKTVTTQLAATDPAVTHNPRNLEHTPGGSSSGSAAAVADGMVAAAFGTQTIGSTLRPAAFCGIVGLKASYGRVSRAGIFPLAWSLDHAGLLTQTVEDAALVLAAVAGAEPGDHTAAGVPAGDHSAAVRDPKPPRIGLLRDFFQQRCDSAYWARLEETAQRFAHAGAEVEEAKLPAGFDLAINVSQTILACEAYAAYGNVFRLRADDFASQVRVLLESGALVPANSYLRAQLLRRQLVESVRPLFRRYDLLLSASATGPAPHGLGSTGDTVCNAPWTLLGMPALSLPIGLAGNGLPLGLQLTADHWQEERLLAGARWCEMILGPVMPAPAS